MTNLLTNSGLSNKPLSELIKIARKTNSLTQNDFGKFFEPEIAQPTIARWEKGDLLPDRKHFPKIASLLNLTLEEFINITKLQLEDNSHVSSMSEEEIYVHNKRHVSVLNRGVKAWGRWREKNHQIVPQLAGANPKEEYLDEIDLHYADLRGTYFKDKSLRNSKFHGADLRKANLENADLSNADLQGADLRKANLTKADLTNANLWGVDLSEAILVNTVLDKANLIEANLSNADLAGADLRNANLNSVNLENAVLKDCLVYGVSTWDIKIKNTVQENLNICRWEFPRIYINDIRSALIKSLEIANSEDPKISKAMNNAQVALEEQNRSFKELLNQNNNNKGDKDEA